MLKKFKKSKKLLTIPRGKCYNCCINLKVRMNAMTQTVVLHAIRMSDARMFPSGVLSVAVQ